ncbi:amino acid adenylation domain-containing protein [Chitinophaga varians]|uniref:Amino acid adenylation domain-containing protein n=1 Tax=Chitinophaga varians TaxID=2202339 RepID=A0A847S2J2_9BACT|nr:non-ribosomal peptide synthetase [Chitinophaga varians]NLR68624.1 amino acid adenylation domain-containing protein [Chitinophaga varians]
MNVNIIDCLLHNAAIGNSVGITLINSEHDSELMSYRQLLHAAQCMLHQLQEKGVAKGNEIVLQIEDNKTLLIAFWACVIGKFIPVPLSVESKASHKVKLTAVWKKLNHPYLFTDKKQLEDIRDIMVAEGLQELPTRSIVWEELKTSGPLAPVAVTTGDDIAFIQFSSGSTGDPKGVILTHENLITNTKDIISASGMDSNARSLSWMPLTHDMGMICFHLSSLTANINQYLIPTSLFIRRPVMWISKAGEYGATHLYSPNFGYHYFLQALERLSVVPEWDLSSVKLIYNGAEPISYEICRQFVEALTPYKLKKNVVFPGYGLAEASVAVTLSELDQPLVVLNLDRNHLQVGECIQEAEYPQDGVAFVGVGYPIIHCKVRVCDKAGVILPEGHIGHVQIKGGNVTRGYYNDEVRSAELFTADNWLKTGDIGFFRDDMLFLTGREKNIIIINGQNYYPQDIERAAEKVPGLEPGKVVACGVPDLDGRTALIVFILYKGTLAGFLPVAQSVKKFVLDATGLIADDVLPVKKIPKTTSGKIRNFALVKQYQTGEFDKIRQELRTLFTSTHINTNVKEKLTAVWNYLFGVVPDPGQSFVEMGLNSLQAMSLLNRLRIDFDINLTVKDLFVYPSISKLAALLEAQRAPVEVTVYTGQTVGMPDEAGKILPMQRKFWYLHQYNEESKSALNIALSASVKGHIQIAALETAVNRLILRHECLRSSFLLKENGPMLQVQELPLSNEIEIMDMSGEENPIGMANEWMMTAVNRPFNLTAAPLMRCCIARYSQTESLLSLVFHHIIADGWSLTIFANEFTEDYNAAVSGAILPERQKAAATSAFISWYDSQPARYFQKDMDYWRKQLRDGLIQPELPVYNRKTALLSFKGGQVTTQLPVELIGSVDSYCKTQEATLFMGLLAVLRGLLFRYTAQPKVHLGINTSGRNSHLLEQMTGCLLNQAILGIEAGRADTFESLLQKVRAAVIESLDHQVLYLDGLLEQIADEGELSWVAPDIFVLFQNFAELPSLQGMEKSGLNITPNELPVNTTPANMIFEFIIGHPGEAVNLNLRYNSNLISEQAVEGLLEHYKNLCTGLVRKTDVPIVDIPLLSGEEHAQLLTWGRGNKRGDVFTPACAMIAKHALQRPDAIAVIAQERLVTYHELTVEIDRVVALLQKKGAVKGDPIGVLIPRSAEAIILMLGIMKAGTIYVPIDTVYPVARIQYIIENAAVKFVFANTETRPLLDTIGGVNVLSSTDSTPRTAADTSEDSRCCQEDPAYILYTSGSTGKPKGVIISHGSLVDYANTFVRYFEITSADKVLHQATIAFDIAMEEIFPVLTAGGSVVIAEEGGRDIEGLIDRITTHDVTVVSTTPMVIYELNKREFFLNKLRILISGGDKLKATHIDRLLPSVSVYNTYGPTETTVCATYYKVGSIENASLIGRPIENRNIYIVGAHGDLQVKGGIGEIYIGGKGLASGYVNDPEQTGLVFGNHTFTSERLYRTGDLGRWNSAGELVFLGRKDEQVKLHGYRVEIGEIEQALLHTPGIKDAAIIKDDRDDKLKLYGFYTADNEIEKESLLTALRSQLPAYMLPLWLTYLDRMPLTGNGKVDSKALLAIIDIHRQDVSKQYTTSRNSTEAEILKLWSAVLEQEINDIDANFFERGGNSILGTRVLHALIGLLKVDVSLADLFMYPTVRSLTAALAARPFNVKGLEKVPPRLYYDLSYAQRRMWLLTQKQQNENAYVITASYKVTGNLDVDVLNQAMDIMIAKHEMLRTTFVETEGDIKQRVYALAPGGFAAEVAVMEKDALTKGMLKKEIYTQLRRPFDLSVWPLIRVVVYKLADEEQVIFFNIHHIICDGLSMNILAAGLFEAYYELKSGGESARHVKPADFDYTDYVYWQQQLLNDHTGAESSAYWLKKITDTPHLLQHFSIRQEDAVPTVSGATILEIWPQDVIKNIRQFCTQYATTSYALLLSVVKVLLYTYTKGQPLITVGSPFSGRTLKELETLVGLFLNNIVLQTAIAPGDTFAMLLKNVKEEIAHAMKHQQYPYDKLVEELHGHRSSPDNPFYDVLVVHQEDRLTDIINGFNGNAHTLRLQDLRIYNPISKLGLSFFFREAVSHLAVEIEYSTRLFNGPLITAMAGDLLKMTHIVLADPEIQMRTLRLHFQDEVTREEHSSFKDATLINIDDSF